MPDIQDSFDLQAGVPIRASDQVADKAARNALYFRYARMEVVTLDDQVKWRLLPNPNGDDFSNWGHADLHWEPSGAGSVDLTNYYTKQETYSQAEIDAFLQGVEEVLDFPLRSDFPPTGAAATLYIAKNDHLTPPAPVAYRWSAAINDYVAVSSPGQDLTPYLTIAAAAGIYSPLGHGHNIGEVSGLQQALDGKENLVNFNGPSQYFGTDAAGTKGVHNLLPAPPLYPSTGQNTDGAMTQKATTDAITEVNADSIQRDAALAGQITSIFGLIGNLPSLVTVAKNNLVAVANELWALIQGLTGRVEDLEGAVNGQTVTTRLREDFVYAGSNVFQLTYLPEEVYLAFVEGPFTKHFTVDFAAGTVTITSQAGGRQWAMGDEVSIDYHHLGELSLIPEGNLWVDKNGNYITDKNGNYIEIQTA